MSGRRPPQVDPQQLSRKRPDKLTTAIGCIGGGIAISTIIAHIAYCVIRILTTVVT
jgi:hypothetical protein